MLLVATFTRRTLVPQTQRQPLPQQHVDAVLAQQRLAAPAEDRLLLALVEATTHELNHRRRRCLEGRTACEVYHDTTLRRPLNRKSREEVLRLLRRDF